jgi:hypothetical protein
MPVAARLQASTPKLRLIKSGMRASSVYIHAHWITGGFAIFNINTVCIDAAAVSRSLHQPAAVVSQLAAAAVPYWAPRDLEVGSGLSKDISFTQLILSLSL